MIAILAPKSAIYRGIIQHISWLKNIVASVVSARIMFVVGPQRFYATFANCLKQIAIQENV